MNYEGQAAIELEMAIEESQKSKVKSKNYRYKIQKDKDIYIIDVEETIKGIVEDFPTNTLVVGV